MDGDSKRQRVLTMADSLAPMTAATAPKDMDGLPIDADKMFSDHKGTHKPRIEKKQRALLKKVAFLKEFLEDGETLLAITTAVSPTSFLEQWTTGFIFVYIKRCLLVVTNRRIFHIPTTAGYKYRRSIAQIRYADIETIQQKGSRLKIKYKSNQKDLFLYVRRSERKKIRALLPHVSMQGAESEAGKRVHLCPRCTSELEFDVYVCSNCKLEFKSRSTALKLSMWLPGGGYFYTGHPILGISDALLEAILIFAIVFALIPTPEYPEPDYVGAASIGVFLVIEKLITIYHANHFIREYLTKEKDIKTASAFD